MLGCLTCSKAHTVPHNYNDDVADDDVAAAGADAE